MMVKKVRFVREPADGLALNVLGVTHPRKATGAETAGAFSLWEALVQLGAGASPHTHTREVEAFYVLSGKLLIEIEGEPAPRVLIRPPPPASRFQKWQSACPSAQMALPKTDPGPFGAVFVSARS